MEATAFGRFQIRFAQLARGVFDSAVVSTFCKDQGSPSSSQTLDLRRCRRVLRPEDTPSPSKKLCAVGKLTHTTQFPTLCFALALRDHLTFSCDFDVEVRLQHPAYLIDVNLQIQACFCTLYSEIACCRVLFSDIYHKTLNECSLQKRHNLSK